MRLRTTVSGIMGEAKASGTSDAYTRSATFLHAANEEIREEIQAATSGKIQAIIRKLESREKLDSEEKELVKTWIVGDAQSHVAVENNFNDWVEEFQRLQAAISRYENREISEMDWFGLHGMVQDAMRVAADIADFLEKKERIQRFEEASREIDEGGADVLLMMLTAKLGSPDL